MKMLLLYMSPFLIAGYLGYLTVHLTPRRVHNLSFWIASASLVLVGLIMPLLLPNLSTGIQGAISVHSAPLLIVAGGAALVAFYFLSSIVQEVRRGIPEQISYFRLNQIIRSVIVSALCALFIWLSLPAVSFASSGSIILSTFGMSLGALTVRNTIQEERLYLTHLIRLSLGTHELSDQEICFLCDSLKALRTDLSNAALPDAHTATLTLGNAMLTVSDTAREQHAIALDGLPPRGWVNGALHHRDLLYKETSHLYASATHAENPVAPVRTSPEWSFTAYGDMVDEHRALNEERYGFGIIAASAEMKAILFQIAQAAHRDNPLILIGEHGTGKSLLAQLALKKSGYSQIFTFDVINAEEETPLLNNIQELIGSGNTELGIVVENAQLLSSQRWQELRSFLAANPSSRAIALAGTALPAEVDEEGTDILRIAPLRDRKHDLFFLMVQFVSEASDALQRPIERVSISVLDEIFTYSWPGNCDELRSVCIQAVQNASGGILESLLHVGALETR